MRLATPAYPPAGIREAVPRRLSREDGDVAVAESRSHIRDTGDHTAQNLLSFTNFGDIAAG